jgi:hypothetical protein
VFVFYPAAFQITGQYSVLLPDGRVQTVTYSVRPETGFVVRDPSPSPSSSPSSTAYSPSRLK